MEQTDRSADMHPVCLHGTFAVGVDCRLFEVNRGGVVVC
jgi:hypothetical protein